MAWIYLFLVILVFYTPALGLGPLLLRTDLEISISGLRVPIPFTGALRLLVGSLLSWWALWTLTRWLEERTGFDIFYWLDQHMPFLHLRERWIYAIRPPISTRLAVWVADIGLAISGAKVIGVLLLGILLAVAVPQLISTALPGLIETLVARFPGAGWVETLVGWLSGPLMEWLAGSVMGWLSNALKETLGFGPPAYLFIVSILVLVANRAYQREREERYQRDIQRLQEERKRTQGEIMVSLST